MKRNYSFLVIMLVSMLSFSFSNQLSAQSAGKRIIVDPTSTTNSGTSFSTIKMAVDSASSGDTVIVSEGTYNEKIKVNKRLVLASNFLLDGDTSHISKTIISGTGINQNSTSDALVFCTSFDRDTANFKFVGFTVSNASKYSMYVTVATISNCILQNSGNVQTNPFYFQGTKVVNSKFINNIGIMVIYADWVNPDYQPGFNVANCTFVNNTALGVSGLFPSPNNSGIVYINNSPSLFTNNIFYNNSGDNLISLAASKWNTNVDSINFYNNTFVYNNTRTALFRSWEGRNDISDPNFISIWYNNIINNNYKLATRTDVQGEFMFGGGNNAKNSTTTFKNNIMASDLNIDQSTGFSGNFTFNFDNTNIKATPVFKDTARLNFSLVDTSAGIGMGIVSDLLPKSDLFGKSRPTPAGSSPDLGAVENDNRYPTPIITSLSKAKSGGVNAIKVNYSIPVSPAPDSIIIYRAVTNDSAVILASTRKDTIAFSPTASLTFLDKTNVQNSTSYYYIVKTLFANKLKSSASSIATITTGTSTSTVIVPSGLTVTQANSRSGLSLTWTATSNTYTGTSTTPTNTPYIDIYRGLTKATASLLSTLRDTTTTYLDNSVTSETQYYYYLINRDVNNVVSDTSVNASFKTATPSTVSFYVSPSGSDNTTSNDGSLSRPFKTLKFTFTKALKGDTLIALPGVYNEKVSITPGVIFASKYILNNDTTEISKVIFNAAGLNGNAISYNTNNTNGQWIRTNVIGIKFTGAGGYGKMLYTGNGQTGQTFFSFNNCIFAQNGPKDMVHTDNRNPDQDIIYAQFNDSTSFQNSRFEDNYGRIEVNGRGIQIINNVFKYNFKNITRQNQDWIGYGIFRGWVNGKTIVANNIFAYNGIPWNDMNQHSLIRLNGSDSIYYTNNTFYGNRAPVMIFENNNPKAFITNNIFDKNTINMYANSNANVDYIFKNNFFNSNPENDNLISNLNGQFVNNIWDSTSGFADTTNFILSPTSKLINSGTNTFGSNNGQAVPSKDIYGNNRPGPAGTNSDIGAVESEFGFPSPVLVSLDGGDKSVYVKWQKPINGSINGYEIFRSTSSITSPTTPIITINKADSLFIIDTALTNLTKYYYRVRAYSGTVSKTYSALSNELSVKPNTPPSAIDTVSTYEGPRNVAIIWSDTSQVKRKYNIYRGLTTGSLDKIASNIDTTYYVDKLVVANTKYYYGVKVVDSVGATSNISKLAYSTPNNIWIIDTIGKATGNASINNPIKSIQYAINNGKAGDTILINNGTYVESLELLSKSYVIKAKNIGKVIVNPQNPSSDNVLRINDGNDIWGSGNEYSKPRNKFIGITFSGSSYVQWQNNYPASAILIWQGSNPIFESCTFSNNASNFVFTIDQSAPLFLNCIIANNTSQSGVFEIWGGQNSDLPRKKVAKIVNSTIVNNSYFSRSNGGSQNGIVIFNSIINSNGYDLNNFSDKTFNVVSSIVDNQKLLSQSSSNKLIDPQVNNNFTLTNYSPALGKSQDLLVLTSSQLNDTLRALTYDYNYASRPSPTGTKADLGAIENKYSVAAPLITRLQKSGTSITLTWEKGDATTNFNSIKVYRDTLASALDTLATPLNITVDTSSTITISDVLPNNKVYYYALKATVGTGANAVTTGLSNVKSTLDTIFVPNLAFGNDTASIKVRATSRNGNAMGQMINLVKLASDGATALPKLILYSQETKSVDSTKTAGGGIPSDSLMVLNVLSGTAPNSIKLGLNRSVSISKGKSGDQLQIIGAMNVNGDDEFDFVGIFKNHNEISQRSTVVYLNNNNLSFGLDTINAPRAFFNQNINSWNQTTNLVYKWDQKSFDYNASNTGGQYVESAVERMDGNFDGKEEVIATLQQVKWEPNPLLNFGNNASISQINSNIRIVKFIDINNDGIPDIFGINNCPGCIGLPQTNGNPLLAFVSNKKDGKFYMYVTGINIDWNTNLYFADFLNNRKVQVMARISGGNYRIYGFDNNYAATTSPIQIDATLNDGKMDVGDINNDGSPDVVTVDNSGNFVAYINNHQSSFVKKSLGAPSYNSNAIWSLFNLKIVDINRDGFKDLMWLENVPESDGSVNWSSNNFALKTWIQSTGSQTRTAPTAISTDAISITNDGYKVKVKWTPTKDAIDNYMYANVKVDTLANFKAARINNGYNYRASNPTIPIVLDKVYARNYPDSLEFNDINLTSKKPYYVAVQMVNKDGQSSAYTSAIYTPVDPLTSIDNVIPGLYNARFAWGDYNNDGLLDLAVMGQSDNGNVTKVYQNTGSGFVDLNLTNRAFRYGDIKWVDLNNDGWLDIAMIGQPGSTGVSFQTLINNKGVFEVNTPTTVNGLKYANMAFGDIDNNGTLDMFTAGQDASGNAHSYMYKNDGKGNFTIDQEFNTYNVVPNMSYADARFVDYDLDGDLDLVYAGTGQDGSPQGGVRVNTLLDPKITTNSYSNAGSTNNGYTYNLNTYNNDCQCNVGLSMKNARFDMGDIDGDGDIDIVEIGTARKYSGSSYTEVPQLIILRNQTIENKNAKYGNYFSYGNIYSTTAVILDSISDGDVKLVDFNNDGLLDITVTGLDQSANAVTKFYLNQGGFGNFTLSKNASIPQYSQSAISWGDANGDGNMDLVISGNKTVGSSTSIYLNNQGTNGNKAPTTPNNLRFIDQGQGRILLQWDASTDDHTNSANLYYNLKLGTKPGLSDLRVIQVNATTDQLLTPNTSLIGSNQYYIELPPGVYYWSVQAVDGNYTSSHFASNQKIVLKYPWQFVNQGGIVDTRIQPLEKPAFAWADVNNNGVFDFLYLGHVTNGGDFGNSNTPVGLYRNMGGKFSKLKNDSTQSTIAGTGTNFRDDLAGIVNAQIKWIDLNNDGLLDLVVAGNDVNSSNGKLAIFRNKGNYKFENITGNIYPGSFGNYLTDPKIEFVDLDNNGYKDMIYTGTDNQGGAVGVFKFVGFYKDTTNKTTGIKSAQIKSNLDQLLSNVSNVSLAIGDINKDLKTDLAILYDDGYSAARIGAVYMNTSDTTNAISFTRSNTITLPALNNATIDLIDYNNDGLLDLALSGKSQSTGQIFRIYQNKWVDSVAKTVQFVQSNANVKSFENGQTTWGDINADGYPDIIFSGIRTGVGPISSMAIADPSSAKVNGIIKYNELPTFPFGNYSVMRPSLGDFSGKKVLDLVLVGTEKVTDPVTNTSTTNSSFKILKNVRDLSAAVVDPTTVAGTYSSVGTIKSMALASTATATSESIFSNSIRGFAVDSSVAVVDSNYIENSYALNKAPVSPQIAGSQIVSQVGSQFLVQLNWKAASDDNTPSDGLTYAVSIGTKAGSSDILDGNAALNTGIRKTPDMGNAGKNTSMNVLLSPGTYYWTVQSIDGSNAGSKFAPTNTIQVNGNRSLVERSAPYDILLNNATTSSLYMKQGDSTVKYKLTTADKDTTAVIKYSIISDATVTSDAIFKLDTVNNYLLLNSKPANASYKVKLRATDNYGALFEKVFTFTVIQAPTKILVNAKDSSLIYYNKSNADSAKFSLQLSASYDTPPSITPILTYQYVSGAGGENNGLFDLANTVLINKRRLDNADTIKLRVSVTDQYGLSVERLIKLINSDCAKVPTLVIKANATACLPLVVNLTDTAVTTGSAALLKYSYFSDINATLKVADPTKVATTGVYYIKATDTLGCSIAKPISVSVSSQPAVPTIAAASICQNSTAVNIAYTAPSAAVKLVWYGNNATGGTPSTVTPSFNTSAAGTLSYYVGQADTVAGCYSDRVKLDIIVKPNPAIPTISRDTAGYLKSSVLTGFKWYKDATAVDSTNVQIKPTTPGSYTLKATENGCTTTSAAYYYLVTDIINLSANEYIKLAPNPFVNFLNFDFVVEGYQKLNIEVFEVSTGIKVASRQGLFAGTKLSFSELSSGIYIFKVSSNDNKLSYKFKMVKL